MGEKKFIATLSAFYGLDGYPRDLDETTCTFPTEDQAIAVSEMLRCVPPGPILDLGCGYGRLMEPLAHHASRTVIGIDVVKHCCTIAERRGPVVCADVGCLPIYGSSVAAAISLFTSVGYDDRPIRAVISEVARVLRPGGRFLIDTIGLTKPKRSNFVEHVDNGHLSSISENIDADGVHDLQFSVMGPEGTQAFRLRYRVFGLGDLIDAANSAGLRRVEGVNFAPFRISSAPRNTLLFERP